MDSQEVAGILTHAAQGVLADVSRASLMLLPVFLLIRLMFSYGKSILFNRADALFNFGPILKGFLLMMVLLSYREITWALATTAQAFSGAVGKTPQLSEAFASFSRPYLEDIAHMEGKTWLEKGWDTFEDIKSAFFSLDDLLVGLITSKVLSLVRVVMHFIQQIILAFLYAIGPVAICLSVLPGFSDSGLLWLKGFVGVSFWELTMGVLDKLAYGFSLSYHQLNSSSAFEPLWFEAANVVIIVMYLLVPTLTNYYLRVGSAGGFIGKIGGVAVAATTLRVSRISRK